MSKNDRAWHRFFEKTDTLAKIEAQGFCYVEAQDLKEIARREPRLMAKQDTLSVRPVVFKRNDLVIFPVRNGRYIVFKDPDQKSYYELSAQQYDLQPEVYYSQVALTSFDSYPGSQSLSESQAIDFAYVSSLIKGFTQDNDLCLTIRGRLYSGQFHFCLPVTGYHVDVQSVQIEVDAGYESPNGIYLIEAKVGKRQDFHIRQLYYPYLEWSHRSQKRIVPIFLAYSNGKYYFYEFSFSQQFGSLRLDRSACYTINESPLARIDIVELLQDTTTELEPDDIPYPQANDLDKVVDVISLVGSGITTKTAIADFFEFDERQGDYYANAGRYLGLLDRTGQEYALTDLGGHLLETRSISQRTGMLVRQMITRPTFRKAFKLLIEHGFEVEAVAANDIAQVVEEFTDLSGSTPPRRASTVKNWLRWVVRNSEA